MKQMFHVLQLATEIHYVLFFQLSVSYNEFCHSQQHFAATTTTGNVYVNRQPKVTKGLKSGSVETLCSVVPPVASCGAEDTIECCEYVNSSFDILHSQNKELKHEV